MNIQLFPALAQGPQLDVSQARVQNSAALSALAPGDVIEAKVVAQNGHNVTLQTPEGARFQALLGERPLPVGQRLQLTVTAQGAEATTVEITSMTSLDLPLALRSINAPAIRENILLAQEMAAQKLPITKENFAALKTMLASHKSLSPEQAVFMAGQRIPVTARSIAQFQGFLQQNHQLGQGLNALAELLGDLEPAAFEPLSAAVQAEPERGFVPRQTPQAQPEAPPLASAVPDQPTARSGQAQATQEKPATPQAPQAAQTPQAQPGALPDAPPLASAVPGEPAARSGQAQATQELPATPQAPQAQPGAQPDAPPLPTAAPGEPAARSGQAQVTQEQPATPQAPAQGGPSSAPLPDALRQAETAAPRTADSQKPAIVQEQDAPPQAPTLAQMAKALFRRVEADRGFALRHELEAPVLRRELAQLLTKVEQKAAELPESSRTPLLKLTQGIEQSARFMQQINQFTAYLQVPLTVNDRQTTAELYVFGDESRARKIDPQNATLFLSLGTASAGRVETFVRVTGKTIECDFGLQDEETAALFRQNMGSLGELLTAQGFRLARTSAQTIEKETDIIGVSRQMAHRSAKYTFDRTV